MESGKTCKMLCRVGVLKIEQVDKYGLTWVVVQRVTEQNCPQSVMFWN